jgi:carbohydrate diacid regulator
MQPSLNFPMLELCSREGYMAGWHLDTKMAQDIVARTMRIIDTNINVMDARGRIIGSGDRERIGELHEGALLVLSQGRVVDIDDAVAKHLHGVRQGINLPLRLEGEIVGVIGLTGEPESLRKYGELVCMTAEMMLEQSRLMHLLAGQPPARRAGDEPYSGGRAYACAQRMGAASGDRSEPAARGGGD